MLSHQPAFWSARAETKSGSWLWSLLQSSGGLIQPVTECVLAPVTESLGYYEGAAVISSVSQIRQQIGYKAEEKQLTRAEQSNQTYVLIPVSELRHVLRDEARALKIEVSVFSKLANSNFLAYLDDCNFFIISS